MLNPGSIVQVRNRYWVLLPHPDPHLYALRPLTEARHPEPDTHNCDPCRIVSMHGKFAFPLHLVE